MSVQANEAFRCELITWLAANPAPKSAGTDHHSQFLARRKWQRLLAGGGWAGVHWPRAYGGRGATMSQSAIFFEELARHQAPLPANVLGLLLAGPTIMEYGSEDQKQRYLGPILTAEEIWCQGFSEPEAGSDLAAVKTLAKRINGGWRITGQKVWTSYARYAKWCMLLARTDTKPGRHAGLTYFLLDMEAPGVEVRPLKEITGDAHFNELFIDGVEVDDEQILGEVGCGWQVALSTLMNERSGLAFFHQVRMRQLLDRLVATATESGAIDEPSTRTRLGEILARIETLRLTAYRGVATIERTGKPGPESSLTKLMWSSSNQALTELAEELLGMDALVSDSSWGYELLRSRGNSIEGGTTEILKTVAAERVLQLPKSRRNS